MNGEQVPAWWCEAYGPPEGGVPAAEWPRCFLSPDASVRDCTDALTCAHVMGEERRRVFSAIQASAAAGDPVGVALAEDLASPDDLLGGGGRWSSSGAG